MQIDKCKQNDINEVYNLVCELEGTKFDYNDFKITFNNKIKNENTYCIVCRNENNILGFLNLNIDYQLHHNGKIATIEELIVGNKHRSNGIGGLLLESAIAYAKNSKCKTIELTSNFSRERAHDFYTKNGFEKVSFKFKMELTG